MDRHGVRYIFEHQLLPTWFYVDKMAFVEMLIQSEGVIYRIISGIFDKEYVENPYKEDQFTVNGARLPDGLYMIRIGFPPPEEVPLCYCSYLFFDEAFEKTGFYCIEKGCVKDDGSAFICSWASDGSHINHGRCLLERKNVFIRCVELHYAKYPELERNKGR